MLIKLKSTLTVLNCYDKQHVCASASIFTLDKPIAEK